MKRRELLLLLGSAMTPARSLRAQQKAMPVIGCLGDGWWYTTAEFRQGLREIGYIERQNLMIEYRWAEGHYDQLPALVAEFVRLKAAVIVPAGNVAALVIAGHAVDFAGGVRVEALPSKDLIGGSRGFRRPGYIVSFEPSVTYVTKKVSFNIAVPKALKRDRTQSNADKRQTADTGKYTQGDAAFADYLISAGMTFKL